MYQVKLTDSYFPAQQDHDVLDTTVGNVLRAQAKLTPNVGALVAAAMDGAIGRTWTYAELLADAERLARALLSRFEPGERICVWAPNSPVWVFLE
jgi:fatty-acyl-CoA synthase